MGDARLSGAAVVPGLAVAVGPAKVIGFDPLGGNVLWSVDRARGPIVPAAVDLSVGEHGVVVYTEGAGRSTSALVAIDAFTQAKVWRVALGDATQSAPTISDGRVFVGAADGFVYAVEAGNGAVAWKTRTTGRIAAAVAVADGMVFAVSENVTSGRAALAAFRADTGKIAWSFSPARLPTGASSPTVAAGLVYAGFGDGTVRALDERTGAQRWREPVRIDFSPLTSPAFAGGALFVVDRDGGLYRFDAKSGTRRWDYQFRGTADWGVPLVSGRFVVVGLDDGTLGAVDTATGHLVWETDLGTGPLGPLAAADGRLLVPSVGGRGGLTGFGNDPAARLLDRASPTRLNFALAVLNFLAGGAVAIVVLVAAFRRLSPRLLPLFPRVPGPEGPPPGGPSGGSA